MNEARYNAFLSYGRAHRDVASILHRDLERFGRPFYRPRAIRVFRDRIELAAGDSLPTGIESALRSSSYCILLASPETAESRWVRREVATWLEQHNGRAERLLIVLVDGVVEWDSARDDFDWARSTALPRDILEGAFPQEPLYVDLSWARSSTDLRMGDSPYFDVVLTLAATLREIPKSDMLWQDARQGRKTIRYWQVAAGLLVLVFGGLLWVAHSLRTTRAAEAESERVVALRRAEGLHDELKANLSVANLHMGLLGILAADDTVLWPPSELVATLGPLRQRIAESPFQEAQFVTLQTEPELLPPPVWSLTQSFYSQVAHARGALRDAFGGIEDLHASTQTHEQLADVVHAYLGSIEAAYHLVHTSGRALGDALEGAHPELAVPETVDGYLQDNSQYLEAARNGDVSNGARQVIRRGHPVGRLLREQFTAVDPDDLKKHLQLGAAARGLGDTLLARQVYEAILQRFAADPEMVVYAEGALFRLEHPTLFQLQGGVIVTGFADDSAARVSGVRVGDFLLKYGGTDLDSVDRLIGAIGDSSGATASLLVLRAEEMLVIEVPVGPLGLSVKDY